MIKPPTIDENRSFLIALAKRIFANVDFTPGTPQYGAIDVIASALTDGKIHATRAFRGLSRRYAKGEEQDAIGFVDGIPRKDATIARKDAALRVYGTAGATVADGLALTHSSGIRFVTVGSAVVSSLEFVDVGIASIDKGSAARLPAGESLAFDAAPAGLNENAELQIAIDEGGEDIEPDDEYGNRLLSHTQDRPAGGADADWREWILQTPGLSSAYIYPVRAGLGTVDLAALHNGRGAARCMLPGEVIDLQARIEALRPVISRPRVLTVSAKPTAAEVLIVDDGSIESRSDWDDRSPGVVSGWNFGTRTLTFVARPPSLKANDRIIFSTLAGTGAVYRVEALAGSNDVILTVAPSVAPVNGDLIYAGGTLADRARESVLAYFDKLGPSNPDASRYGAWDGTLRPTKLGDAARSVAGCSDAVTIVPVANVEGADLPWPLDGAVELITPGRVIVRWKR